WYSIMGGRKRMIRGKDIEHPYPVEQPLLANLCQIAFFLEQVADSIYEHQYKPLHDLYLTAERIYSQLQRWASSAGIGSLATAQRKISSELTALSTLHNAYYQVIQVIFRPFLATDYTLHTQEAGEIWLRHACRIAIDAAIDGITFVKTIFQALNLQKLRRRDAFFLEMSCSLLLIESLRQPSKHPNNIIYINSAIDTLKSMPNDAPVTTVIYSIQSITDAVEKFIALQNPLQAVPTLSAFSNCSMAPGIKERIKSVGSILNDQDSSSGTLFGSQEQFPPFLLSATGQSTSPSFPESTPH
ncbi:hypothetical protein FALBO_15048, partial [Fusarium albosuccineum]